MLKFSGAALLAGITAGYIYFDDPLYGLIIYVCIMFAYPIYREGAERKLRQELLLEFRDLLYSLSASFSLGRNMKQALEESLVFWGNTYSEKDIIVKEISEMIREMEETKVQDVKVLRDFAERSGLQDIKDFVSVYETLRITGGDLPRAISRAASVIGDKISIEKELNTALSEKLTEGRIVGLAPFVMTLFMKLMSPGYMRPMYDTFQGNVMSALSLALSAFAIILIERINRIEL